MCDSVYDRILGSEASKVWRYHLKRKKPESSSVYMEESRRGGRTAQRLWSLMADGKEGSAKGGVTEQQSDAKKGQWQWAYAQTLWLYCCAGEFWQQIGRG